MNKKEKREIHRSWGLVLAGTALAYFTSVAASATFEILESLGWSPAIILVISFVFISIFVFKFERMLKKL